MTDAQPTATVAGQSIALHVTGYPDIPNRWGAGRIRATGIRIDYGSSISPDARHVFVTGLWIREDGEATDNPLDRYYDAPTGDTSGWPEWIADLTRKHTPTMMRAAVLREAADLADVRAEGERSLSSSDHDEEAYAAGALGHLANHLRSLAAEAQQQPDTGEETRSTLRERHRAAWNALTPAEQDARIAALDATDDQPDGEA